MSSLNFYLKDQKGLLCTVCTLNSCDESDPLCLYREAVRKENREKRVSQRPVKRKAYRKYYEANTEAEKARVAQWQRDNVEKCREKSKRYYARKHLATITV